jgi:hypothetical protein
MVVTLSVLKCPRGRLNFEAPSKNRAKEVALEVSHRVKGWLKVFWFRNTPSNDATRLTHQFPITRP